MVKQKKTEKPGVATAARGLLTVENPLENAHAAAHRILNAIEDLHGLLVREPEPRGAHRLVLDLVRAVDDMHGLWHLVADAFARAAPSLAVVLGNTAASAHDGVRRMGLAAAFGVVGAAARSSPSGRETEPEMMVAVRLAGIALQDPAKDCGAAAIAWARATLRPVEPARWGQIQAMLTFERVGAVGFYELAEFAGMPEDQKQVLRQMLDHPGTRWSKDDLRSDRYWAGTHKRRTLRAIDELVVRGIVQHHGRRGGYALVETHPLVLALREGGPLVAP